jgi:CRISPR-associated protein Cas2
MKSFWIVSYDIADPKRLRKVAKFLEGYGYRLQESVFRVHVNVTDIERIKWELNLRTTDSDSILYFRFCNSCALNIQKQNKSLENVFKNDNFIVV